MGSTEIKRNRERDLVLMPGSNNILFEKFDAAECLKKDDYSAVYLADHIYLGKKIILKILNTELIQDETIILRFKREAQILAKLDHPNIIKVLDFGTYDRQFYISFEYFESRTLRKLIQTGDLAPEQKKKIVIQLLKGLEYAHLSRVIHRDLKPENIFVDFNTNLKLGDFGLALAEGENFATKVSSVSGTPCYMSPEQIGGAALDERSDIFSVGIIIYELYTGKNPFLGRDINDSINRILSFDEKKTHLSFEEIPDDAAALLKNLLRKNPGERLENAAEAYKYLGIENDNIKVDTGGSTGSNRKVFGFWAAVLFILIAGFIFIIYTSNGNSERYDENTPLKNIETLSQNNSSGETKSSEEPVEEKTEALIPEKSEDRETVKSESGSDTVGMTEIGENEKSVAGSGEIFIECLPWAHVYLDSYNIETTPIERNIPVKAGVHSLKLVHPDYPVYEQSFRISADEFLSFKVNLDTLMGYLSCRVYPWGKIFIDEEFKGTTPLFEPIKLTPGDYEIKVKNDSYEEYKKEVSITRGDTTRIEVNFK